MMRLFLPDETGTVALAKALSASAPDGAVVHLHGDLGAGKSTLARAWLRSLGVTGPVRSPTYTLVERYPLPAGGEAVHLDLYRIGDAAELDYLGLDDIDPRLWLAEWPERGGRALPEADLRIRLSVEGDGRSARLEAVSGRGGEWLARLAWPESLRPLSEPSQ